MSKPLFGKKTFIFLTTLILLSSISVSAFAYVTSGKKWPSSAITYYIISGTPFYGYSGAISTATGWWDSKTDVSLTGQSNGNISVMAADYGYTSWDGITQSNSYTDTKTYYAAYISLNRYHTDGYISSGNTLRLTLVTAHEFGHALGLSHAISGFPMMFGADVWNAYQENNSLANGPTQDDIDGINSIY